MKILAVVAKGYVDEPSIKRKLSELPPDTIIVHGDNSVIESVAKSLNLTTKVYSADFIALGGDAIFARDKQMIYDEGANTFDHTLIFCKNLVNVDRLTNNFVTLSRTSKITVKICS